LSGWATVRSRFSPSSRADCPDAKCCLGSEASESSRSRFPPQRPAVGFESSDRSRHDRSVTNVGLRGSAVRGQRRCGSARPWRSRYRQIAGWPASPMRRRREAARIGGLLVTDEQIGVGHFHFPIHLRKSPNGGVPHAFFRPALRGGSSRTRAFLGVTPLREHLCVRAPPIVSAALRIEVA
jgi:hypothetical protein